MATELGGRRLHLWSALILVAVFVAGGVAGVGIHAWMRPGWRSRYPHPGELPPHLKELDLTPDQQAKARTIFEKERALVEGVIHEGFPRIRAAREEADQALRTLLTPEQIKTWNDIRARHPPPSGPPGFRHEGDRPPPP